MKRPSDLTTAQDEAKAKALAARDQWLADNLKYSDGVLNMPAGRWLDILKDEFINEARDAEWICEIKGQDGDYTVSLTPKPVEKKKKPKEPAAETTAEELEL